MLIALLSLVLSVPAPETNNEKTVQPNNVLNSWAVDKSEYRNKGSIVIRDETVWKREWKKTSTQETPKVDFSTVMVVGYYWGSQPTSGYTTKVTRVRRGIGATWVTITRTKPKPGDKVDQNTTSPAAFAVVPKGDKVIFLFHR